VADLTKSNYMSELIIKETEVKYQELVSSMEHRSSINYNNKEFEDSVSLSIQLSELRGKLEAKEKKSSESERR